MKMNSYFKFHFPKNRKDLRIMFSLCSKNNKLTHKTSFFTYLLKLLVSIKVNRNIKDKNNRIIYIYFYNEFLFRLII